MRATFPRQFAPLLALSLFLAGPPLRAGDSPVGTRPPEWEATSWLNSGPLTLKGLRGKVVLVRWWTAPGCPYCAATAPALNEFHERYKEKGLVVIGFYHHKSDTPPATVITRVSAAAGRVVVRGTTSDNGAVRRVLVNGRPARALAPNFAEWEAVLEGVRPGALQLAAGAEDAAGNVEKTPHVTHVTVPR